MSKSSQAVVIGPQNVHGFQRVLTKDAIAFVTELHRRFNYTRKSLLAARQQRQVALDKGVVPEFLKETEHIRAGNWKGASLAKDLTDRRVEITGPPDRKMLINALNSGAKVFMADLEDSTSPTWHNLIDGQLNLIDAVDRTIVIKADKPGGKEYKLLSDSSKLATLMVRPRGWHLEEAHVTVDGEPTSASLFDFGLFFFHNAVKLVKRGSGPYFYLPKMESHREARLWNDVFLFAQDYVGLPRGTIRATVLIETILAAFEMDEIIYELKEHSAGLNCGRWDYIFSFIKKFRNHADKLLPDRAQVTMTAPWMANYVRLLIQTCHKRGVHAMGGMAAQIPVKDDQKANEAAFEKVRRDKLREVKAACDGTWVAHPGLIPIAMEIFNAHMSTPNQISNAGDTTPVTAADLLDLGPAGTITEEGLHSNISVGLSYLENWLRGVGCVPLHNLMEDAATAEISRCQVWQWLKHGAKFANGKKVDRATVQKFLDNEINAQEKALGKAYSSRKYPLAYKLYQKLLLAPDLGDFLTLEAYPHIVTTGARSKL